MGQGGFSGPRAVCAVCMRMLIAFAVPAIVFTSLMHAGAPPPLEPPAVLKLTDAERARIVAALPADPRQAGRSTPHSR
jgi:hypothetical protein